jgi:hypothetical protein
MPLRLFEPPSIPGPVRPEDFTRGERDRLRRITTEGDPTRETRDRTLIDRILTQSAGAEFMGPTPGATLAGRQQMDIETGRTIAGAMGESDVLEAERIFQAEGRLGELESQRARELDEFRQLQASHEAAEATMRANFRSGLLRAGLGIATTALFPPAAPAFAFADMFGEGGGGEGVGYRTPVGFGAVEDQPFMSPFDEGDFLPGFPHTQRPGFNPGQTFGFN